jgi:hypothetical protein
MNVASNLLLGPDNDVKRLKHTFNSSSVKYPVKPSKSQRVGTSDLNPKKQSRCFQQAISTSPFANVPAASNFSGQSGKLKSVCTVL